MSAEDKAVLILILSGVLVFLILMRWASYYIKLSEFKNADVSKGKIKDIYFSLSQDGGKKMKGNVDDFEVIPFVKSSVRIVYTYEVDGRVYESNSVSIGDMLGEFSPKANRVFYESALSKWRSGEDIDVYYQKNNPEKSLLLMGVPSYVFKIEAVIFIAAAIAFLFLLNRN